MQALALVSLLFSPSRSYFPRPILSTTSRLFSTTPTQFPRAAVSVTVIDAYIQPAKVLLVKRANEPAKGQWSIPGGKINFGEATLTAGKREIQEETGLTNAHILIRDRPFTATDAISGSFHYVITQYIATTTSAAAAGKVVAGDDASDARWFGMEEIGGLVEGGVATVQLRETLDLALEESTVK